jgi:hypothetical protein
VAEQKVSNTHVKDGTRREEWIEWRNKRDAAFALRTACWQRCR